MIPPELAKKLAQYWEDRNNGVLQHNEGMDDLVLMMQHEIAELDSVDPNPITEGIKHDSSKPDFSLLSPLALTQLTRVLDFGARKYAPHNWRKGIDQTRLLSAAMRHLVAFSSGQDNDPETGLPHMAHVMCCAMFSIELMQSQTNLDHRYEYDSAMIRQLEALLAGK
jgi:hypothetical protein